MSGLSYCYHKLFILMLLDTLGGRQEGPVPRYNHRRFIATKTVTWLSSSLGFNILWKGIFFTPD